MITAKIKWTIKELKEEVLDLLYPEARLALVPKKYWRAKLVSNVNRITFVIHTENLTETKKKIKEIKKWQGILNVMSRYITIHYLYLRIYIKAEWFQPRKKA